MNQSEFILLFLVFSFLHFAFLPLFKKKKVIANLCSQLGDVLEMLSVNCAVKEWITIDVQYCQNFVCIYFVLPLK